MQQDMLLSEDMTQVGAILGERITQDKATTAKIKAQEGVDYYEGKHEILNNRIFYLDDNEVLREDKYVSNIKIPHQFLTELVQQKVNYLLSNPIEVELEYPDEQLLDYLGQYYDDDFQMFLQDLLEGASQKGVEYAYARTTSQDRLKFDVADSLGVFPVYDDNNEIVRLVRYYNKEITKNGQQATITKAEVWTDKLVYLFTSQNGEPFALDTSEELNPRPHIVAVDADGAKYGRDYGQIPFYQFKNNRGAHTDLEPIKALIDDYDLMDAFLSNNLQDFAEAIYVATGFTGDSLDKLRQNIKGKKVMGLPDSAAKLDVRTVTIPVEGRRAKMEIDKANIYQFGMGFDPSQVGDGNITNIVIKSRYSLLDMKCNAVQIRLKTLLKWINELVIADINRRYSKAYNPAQVSFKLTKSALVNDMDEAQRDLIEAQTKKTVIDSILAAAPKLDEESILKLLCEQFDLDWEEVQELLKGQEHTQPVLLDTDPEKPDIDGSSTEQEVETPDGTD
jgi:SPP1 family phage portal protein